ncbi:MAG: hypothetical protein PHS34_08030 [Candidatus Omnitrophica bacterium]|nr:hypothetical protein [Candidatus Nanoarchaeia archaeon]MDD5551191.1 hypothetical protein [Candidatus Omnitrophota bacterium]
MLKSRIENKQLILNPNEGGDLYRLLNRPLFSKKRKIDIITINQLNPNKTELKKLKDFTVESYLIAWGNTTLEEYQRRKSFNIAYINRKILDQVFNFSIDTVTELITDEELQNKLMDSNKRKEILEAIENKDMKKIKKEGFGFLVKFNQEICSEIDWNKILSETFLNKETIIKTEIERVYEKVIRKKMNLLKDCNFGRDIIETLNKEIKNLGVFFRYNELTSEYEQQIFIINFHNRKPKNIRYLFVRNEKNEKTLVEIIEEEIKKKPKYFKIIQQALYKDISLEKTRPNFNSFGPIWTDFMDPNSCIVKREEVDIIIKNLNDFRFHYLYGDPASGKSIIAKYVGYLLAETKCLKIYYFDRDFIKGHHESIIIDIDKIVVDGTILIFEDIQDYIEIFNKILEATNTFENITFIITSRLHRDEMDYLNKDLLFAFTEKKIQFYNIIGRNAIDKIIDNYNSYLKRKTYIEIPVERKNELIDKSGHDLWKLAYLLMSWDGKNINYEQVFSFINEYEFQHVKEKYANYNDSPLELLTLISSFYWMMFSIQIDRFFLIKVLKFNPLLIDEMLADKVLTESENLIGMSHTSIAELYYDTAKKFDYVRYLNYRIHTICNEYDDGLSNILYCYIINGAKNWVHLLRDSVSWYSKAPNRDIVKKNVLQDDRIISFFIKEINKTDNISFTFDLLELIENQIKNKMEQIIFKMDIELFCSRINKSNNVSLIAYHSDILKKYFFQVIEKIDMKNPDLKIVGAYNFLSPPPAIIRIKHLNQKLAERITMKLDTNNIVKQIDYINQFDLKMIYLIDISEGSIEKAIEIINKINTRLLIKTFFKCKINTTIRDPYINDYLEYLYMTSDENSICMEKLSFYFLYLYRLDRSDIGKILLKESKNKLITIENIGELCDFFITILRTNTGDEKIIYPLLTTKLKTNHNLIDACLCIRKIAQTSTKYKKMLYTLITKKLMDNLDNIEFSTCLNIFAGGTSKPITSEGGDWNYIRNVSVKKFWVPNSPGNDSHSINKLIKNVGFNKIKRIIRDKKVFDNFTAYSISMLYAVITTYNKEYGDKLKNIFLNKIHKMKLNLALTTIELMMDFNLSLGERLFYEIDFIKIDKKITDIERYRLIGAYSVHIEMKMIEQFKNKDEKNVTKKMLKRIRTRINEISDVLIKIDSDFPK